METAELIQSLPDSQVQYVLVGGLFANAVEGHLFGRSVPIASIDDLQAMKRIANRPKDRLDIEALEKNSAWRRSE